MSGIIGIARSGESNAVEMQLEKIRHRGGRGRLIREFSAATLGETSADARSAVDGADARPAVVYDGIIHNWSDLALGSATTQAAIEDLYLCEGPEFVSRLDGHFALVAATDDGLFVARDFVGVVPLYYGTRDGAMCAASEVKALTGWADDIREFPPGHYYEHGRGIRPYRKIERREPAAITFSDGASRLCRRLGESVAKYIAADGEMGAWLSGGLDSSAIAALAQQQTHKVKTFAVGVEGAPDLDYARAAANHIGSEHHEMKVTSEDLLDVLPAVIYHLESFDALLVRSSMTNFLVGRLASDHVPAVLSGEGGDELFAGYEYLKAIPSDELPAELVDITNRLHNTALQRVDRCSSAHGLRAHVPFLDRSVLDYALRIPSDYKIRRNGVVMEKWILRMAMVGILPDEILTRPKAKFWEGAGVVDTIGEYASRIIADDEFAAERRLPDGSLLNTKEELLYYRLFKDCFGEFDDLTFMGRTKGAPCA